MPSSGDSIGHYIVDRELGRGGMGVVYLARDAKLERPVALKSLPPEVGRDPGRRARLEREARTLASVNHPNVAAIHGLEESGGRSFIVLEYVEGPTLAERLRGGVLTPPRAGEGPPLGVAEAVGICRQIALGMDAAHRQGVIHRDLKPANIKIRPDGVVKVLDFGIALGGLTENAAANSDLSTLLMFNARPPDIFATVVGSPGYLSPEQARGKPVGPTTDVWSFGCMLYECLTGLRAFPGETPIDVIAASLLLDPNWRVIPVRTPPNVVSLLRRSLEKEVSKRPSAFSEIAEDLGRALLQLSAPVTLIQAPPTRDDTKATGPSAAAGASLSRDARAIVGRDREVAEIVRLFEKQRHISLIGPVGLGASRLAVRAGQAMREQCPDGVWLVQGAPVADAAFLPWESVLTLGASAEQNDPVMGVVHFLAARAALVVVDGCEHAPAAAAGLMREILATCPHARVLTVSTELLGVEGERGFAVPPLGAPGAEQAGTPGARGRFEAGNLFIDRAVAARPEFRPTPANAPFIASICQKLLGVPLAVELVASMVRTLPVEHLDDRLDQRLRLMSSGPRRPDQVVHLAIEWAMDQLPTNDRFLLQRLAVFSGSFTLTAAAAVVGVSESFPDPARESAAAAPTPNELMVLDLLTRLSAASLVTRLPTRDGGEDRFFLPIIVRRHARDRLQPAQLATVAKRYAKYLLLLAEQGVPRLNGPSGQSWRAKLLPEHANLCGALEWARAHEDGGAADRLQELLAQFRQYASALG